MIYLHVSGHTLSNIKSPLDLFPGAETTNETEDNDDPNN
jgi:hypothetical protein